MKILSNIVASFFGIGYCPLAPGTAASAVVVILYKYFLYEIDWIYFLLLLIIVFFAGVASATHQSQIMRIEDPRRVVIDEVAGQMIPLFLLPPNWILLLAAFFLFRFFDIIKPFPIRRIESFPRGWGIMLDDVTAGLYTGILINIALIIL